MELLFEGSIPLILYLQSLGDGLAVVMKGFTFLGYEEFYLILFPVLYWCIDNTLGLRVGTILLLSGCINTYLKWIFHLPRPYWINTDVVALAPEISFGAPSGHAQNAVAVWGLIATSLNNSWAWFTAISLIFLIGFSRLVLGVHFLLDIFLGWSIGTIFLLIFLYLEKPFRNWAKHKSLWVKIGYIFAASISLIIVGVLINSAFHSWEPPNFWIKNAALASPDDVIAPLALSGVISNAAVLFGLGTGYLVINTQGGFKTKGNLKQYALRYVIGIVGVLLIWMGLDFIFPEGETVVAFIFRYIRYGLAGLWISLGAPWIFLKSQLADSEKR